jgi:hypothetical protein
MSFPSKPSIMSDRQSLIDQIVRLKKSFRAFGQTWNQYNKERGEVDGGVQEFVDKKQMHAVLTDIHKMPE